MSKLQLMVKADRLADLSAVAAVTAMYLDRDGFRGDAELAAERAARLDAMAADYRQAARRFH